MADAKCASENPLKRLRQGPGETQGKARNKGPAKLPAEIELLETRIRFEADGGSRKEVYARQNQRQTGVRQFARLNFDFNRASSKIEIPLVRITHQSGGTADVLPSATN